jgi:hypothetical protein
MAGQVAVACVLLLGATLLARSFHGLLEADVGFDRGNALAARVSLSDGLYSPVARLQALERIAARLEQTPGVVHAAYSSNIPFSPGEIVASFPLQTPDRGTIQIQTSMRIVSRDYFPALGERILEGRGFTDADRPASSRSSRPRCRAPPALPPITTTKRSWESWRMPSGNRSPMRRSQKCSS